ncbi:MAG: L-2-hydroxyglutarate oxidase [Microthrixaceae bacterium]|nr:L-2-hydroxyglutarate oxidase [Microthrixaceae bacterium]MCO5311777.1 L-2-hydroxyglutarate oxidase [Microthrixaceae bacterium]
MTATSTDLDLVVIGAGIVGLASARAVQQLRPDTRVTVIEKESKAAAHQTGRNSGVIHSGIYYPPGSNKAAMVKSGRELLFAFLDEHSIPVDVCGKVIVATATDQLDKLDALHQRGLEHGLNISTMTRAQLREREPHCEGLSALLVPEAGITDYKAMCNALVEEIRAAGGEVLFDTPATAITESADQVTVRTDSRVVTARTMINCSGLQSDKVAQLAGRDTRARIMPFRGEYYELTPQSRSLVRHLIYPVPDPRFPFLGVHFTRMIDGEIHAGPNAVIALAREGYTWGVADFDDIKEMAFDKGSWVLAKKYWKTGMGEMYRSLSKSAFVHALQGLVPEVTAADLIKSKAGIRAQAIRPDGTLVDDFEFADGPRSVHVVNAPSPAATASLAIAHDIAQRWSKIT